MAGTNFNASAIILAAGSSRRMGRDKQFIKIRGRSVIERTVEKFLTLEEISEIILVLSEENIARNGGRFGYEKIKLAPGGKTRMDSLRNGFALLAPACEVVAVHDGARPFVSQEVILKCLYSALENGAAVPVVPLKDTVKEVDNESMRILRTVERSSHYAAQTPQSYRREVLGKLLASECAGSDPTDESQVLEKMGVPVAAVLGDYRNIKLTTEEDVLFAEAVYEKKFD